MVTGNSALGAGFDAGTFQELVWSPQVSDQRRRVEGQNGKKGKAC